jgi:hypothetical protein
MQGICMHAHSSNINKLLRYRYVQILQHCYLDKFWTFSRHCIPVPTGTIHWSLSTEEIFAIIYKMRLLLLAKFKIRIWIRP